MASKFKGKDRRLISKCKEVIEAIENRDIVALDTTKKTSAISTRALMIDPAVAGVSAAFVSVKARLVALLAM